MSKALASECKPVIQKTFLKQTDEDDTFITGLNEALFCAKRGDGIYRHPSNCSRIVQVFNFSYYHMPHFI